MTDQSIFNNETNSQVTPDTNQPGESNNQVTPQDTSLFTNQLAAIKNERGEQKYSNVEEALKGTAHAQQHIQDLTQQLNDLKSNNDTLRDELSNRPTIDTIENMLASHTPANQANSLGEEDVTTIVANALNQAETEKLQAQRQAQAQTNLDTVIKSVTEAYGERAEEVFYGKAQEMGMTTEAFNKLASESPQVVLQLVGKTKSPTITPTIGGSNTTDFQPRQETTVQRNSSGILNGASTAEKLEESNAAKKMVNELDQAGMSIDDLSRPSNYFKYFGK